MPPDLGKKVVLNAQRDRLKSAVEEEYLFQLFEESVQKIKALVYAREKTARSGNMDLAFEESKNIEENTIGIALLILQKKIHRVLNSAKPFFPNQDIREILGKYNNKSYSLITIIWELANYYKHREETDFWKRNTKTINVVDAVGVDKRSNLLKALESLGVSLDDCSQLADHVQKWAEKVLET